MYIHHCLVIVHPSRMPWCSVANVAGREFDAFVLELGHSHRSLSRCRRCEAAVVDACQGSSEEISWLEIEIPCLVFISLTASSSELDYEIYSIHARMLQVGEMEDEGAPFPDMVHIIISGKCSLWICDDGAMNAYDFWCLFLICKVCVW